MSPEKAHAKELFEYGQRAAFNDEYPEALAALRAAQAIDASPKITCNLGLVARRAGSFVEAAESLTRCVAVQELLPRSDETKEHIDGLRQELELARAQVAAVSIEAPEGASLTIDGQTRGPVDSAREYFVEPGWHSFEVTAGGAIVRSRENLPPGKVTRLTLAPPSPSPPEEPRRSAWPMLGWVLTASAGTAGVIAVTASVLDQNAASSELRQAEQKSPRVCAVAGTAADENCSAFKRARDLAGNFRTAAIVSFAAAGALAIGTTVYTIKMSPSPTAPRADVGVGSFRVVVPF